MTTPDPNTQANALLALARKWRSAMTEREELVRPYVDRYDRSRRDHRMPPPKLVKSARDLVRAAHKADHEYEDRVEWILEEYRRLTWADVSS